jgi:REP element-mobilizing transposase RayT
VAQPPSAVTALAKPARGSYRRNLPHLQVKQKTFFVTFSTYERWALPRSVRSLVLEHCLRDHGIKLMVHGVVVMPDHVHMVFTALTDKEGVAFSFAEIMGGIKGASAHSMNRAVKRRGHVWQDESFDHILRSNENMRQKVEYICQNPLRKGLVKSVEEYPWLWREWADGERPGTAEGGCATQESAPTQSVGGRAA